MNLREDIDRELGHAPADPFDLHSTLTQGRTVARRKRTLSALTGAVASVVLATGLYVAVDNTMSAPSRETSVASEAQGNSCETTGVDPSGATCDAQTDPNADNAVTYSPSGELIVRDGWTITDQVDDPIAPVEAVAIAATNGTDSQWALIKYPRPNGDVFAEHVNPTDFPGVTFRSWLNYAKSRWIGTPTTAVVTFTDDGDLVGTQGWTVRQQTTGLTMPSGYKGPSGVTAVVQLEQSPTWFLVRPTPEGAEAFPLLALSAGADIEGVLDYIASPDYVPAEQQMVKNSP